MRRILNMALASVLLSGLSGLTRADDVDPKAVIDKGIKALGGEEKLGKAASYTIKAKGTITFNGNDNEIKTQATVQGLDHYRSEFEGEFNGDAIKGVTVVNGDKGWRKFGDNMMELEGDGIANEKRTIYLAVLPDDSRSAQRQGLQTRGGRRREGRRQIGRRNQGHWARRQGFQAVF